MENEVPYSDWSLDALKRERESYLKGIPRETDINNMLLSQLKIEYNKWMKRYNRMVDGYDRTDGIHILGYRELMNRNKELAEVPEKLLEMDAGKKMLAKSKKEIGQMVYNNLMSDILGYVKKKIFTAIKEFLVEPLCKAIDDMMYGHSFTLNENDRKILSRAIDKSADVVTDQIKKGEQLKGEIESNMPSIDEVEKKLMIKFREE